MSILPLRPIIAVAVWVILIGGLSLYMHSRQPVKAVQAHKSVEAGGNYSLELTTTFSAEPDPFALQSVGSGNAAALEVRLNGREILRITDKISSGTPMVIDPLKGLLEGRNEIYIEANPPITEASKSQALRARLFKDSMLLEDKTFWSDMSSKISTTMNIDLSKESGTERNHEH